MKLFTLIAAMILSFILTRPAISDEITDIEYSETLIFVTYVSSSNRVVCTALRYPDYKLIGSGAGYTTGGVARVMVKIPKKYVGTEPKILCE